MDASTLAVLIAGVLLTACHSFVVYYLTQTRKEASVWAGSLGDAVAYIGESIQEGGRIGADIADTLDRIEGVSAGAGSPTDNHSAGMLDLRGTAGSLITSYIESLIHGGQTIQDRPEEGTIHAEESTDQETKSESTDKPTE